MPKRGIRYPKSVFIEITNFCNLSCMHCNRPLMKRPVGFMRIDLFKKIVDEFSSRLLVLDFSGWGEPLLHPEIFDMVAYAKSKGVRQIVVNTNAICLTDLIINKILSSKIDLLIFSIDAFSKQVYEKIRIKADFDRIQNNIYRYFYLREKGIGKGPITIAQMILMKLNVNEVRKFYKKWKPLFDVVRIRPMASFGQKRKTYSKYSLKSYGKPSSHCSYPWTSMFICWDGSVSMCMNDFDCDVRIGNLSNSSVRELWSSEKFFKLREDLKEGLFTDFCKNCEEWHMCKPLSYTKSFMQEFLPSFFLSYAKLVYYNYFERTF